MATRSLLLDMTQLLFGRAKLASPIPGHQKPSSPAEGTPSQELLIPLLLPSPIMPRAHEIALKYRIGIYDVLYVALAERENAELFTTDDKMIKKLQGQFPFIQSLSSF